MSRLNDNDERASEASDSDMDSNSGSENMNIGQNRANNDADDKISENERMLAQLGGIEGVGCILSTIHYMCRTNAPTGSLNSYRQGRGANILTLNYASI
jgi:hypothetical protein